MPKISDKKKEKISEQIVNLLFSKFPKLIFTSEIAEELARDEEFIKKLLQDLEAKEIVKRINKNPQGKKYLRRSRWRVTNKIHQIYKNHQ